MEDSSNLIAENDVDKVSPQRPPDLCSELEKNLIFLGITAIEDKIQNGVKTTIEALRRAGIRVWILTGDKLETALSVARCVHLFDGAFLPVQRPADNDNKSSRSITYVEDPAKTTKPPLEPTKNATLLEIRTRADLDSLKLQLLPNAFTTEKCSNRTSGSSLFNTVLSSEAIALLKAGDPAMVEVLKRSSSVLCYRMTPSEKATVVGAVQRYLGGKVMAIGDGANDVQMIRCANVGVGISGREGLQVSGYGGIF